jgi:hypothetical protein
MIMNNSSKIIDLSGSCETQLVVEEVPTQCDGAPSLTLGKATCALPWNFLGQELIADVPLASKRSIKRIFILT